MTSRVAAPVVLSAVVFAGLGCVARTETTPTGPTATSVSRTQPRAAPSEPTASQQAVGESRSPDTEPAAAPVSPTATLRAAAETAPPGSTPSYIFTPAQVAVPPPASTPPQSARADATLSAERGTAPLDRRDGRPRAVPGELRLTVVATNKGIARGSILSVDVMASSSSAVVDAPLHLLFDPSVLEYVDGVPGNFLTQGGSSVVFLADGTGQPGDVAIAAGRVERARGASGAGLLCRVRFRGVGAGTSPVRVGEASVWGTRGEALTVVAGRTDVVVR